MRVVNVHVEICLIQRQRCFSQFRQKRQSSILVGAATFKDFDAYKTKRKKSADEVIRFFLRRDVEPGQHVVILSDEVGTAFESLRTGLKVRADRAVKHLLIVRDKYM